MAPSTSAALFNELRREIIIEKVGKKVLTSIAQIVGWFITSSTTFPHVINNWIPRVEKGLRALALAIYGESRNSSSPQLNLNSVGIKIHCLLAHSSRAKDHWNEKCFFHFWFIALPKHRFLIAVRRYNKNVLTLNGYISAAFLFAIIWFIRQLIPSELLVRHNQPWWLGQSLSREIDRVFRKI